MSDRYKEAMAVIIATAMMAFFTTDLVMESEPRESLGLAAVVFLLLWGAYGIIFSLMARFLGLDDGGS